MSSFSNPEIITLLQEKFVPVAANDWYNRRREDATGTFFRDVANQGPRKGEGGRTRQGHYIFTASGKLLGFNNNRSAERRLAFINKALAEWEALPADERKPQSLTVADEAEDPRYTAQPPEGGLVLRSFTRSLKAEAGSPTGLVACADEDVDHPGGHFSAFDHVRIQAEEWQALKEIAESGGGAVPAALALRLVRFHLVDNTRGEPPFWKLDEVRGHGLTIHPTGRAGSYRLEGSAHLETADGERGYEVALRGSVATDAAGTPARFDLVALGNHWGEGRYTLEARPGKTPLGVACELADGSLRSDAIRPQASGYLRGYYEADR